MFDRKKALQWYMCVVNGDGVALVEYIYCWLFRLRWLESLWT